MNSGVFDWQDEHGNSLALVDLGKNGPEKVRNLMPLLARVNPALAQHLSRLTGVKVDTDDRRPNCGPGIKIEIPGDSLVETGTNNLPSTSQRSSTFQP